MAQLKINAFSSWAWASEEEEMGASILTIGNKQTIQNALSDMATTRLNMAYDPKEPITFVQGEAELKGKIQILQWLLDASDAGEIYMAQKASER